MSVPIRPDVTDVRGSRAPTRPRQRDIAEDARSAIQGARDAGLTGQDLQDVIAAWDRKIRQVNMTEAGRLPENPMLKAVLETAETAVSGIPGARLAMSAGRHLVTDRETPFAEIQRQVNAETSDIPIASGLARAGGGAVAGMALPIMSGFKAGAILGGADQLLSNTPNMTPLQRALATGAGAAIGGMTGGVTDYAVRGGRVWKAPNADEYANALRDQRSDATDVLYDVARAEGQQWRNAPGIGAPNSFAAPDIATVVARLRSSRQFANAGDDEILDEAKRILSQQNRASLEVADASPEYLPGPQFKAREADLAKQELMQDADIIMPTLRRADEAFAQQSDRIRAFNEGGDAMSRRLERKRVPFEQLPVEGEDAFLRKIPGMTPEQLQEAGRGVLSATKRTIAVNPQFGVTANMFYPFVALHRAGKFINPIDAALNRTGPSNLRDALVGALSGSTPDGMEDAENIAGGVLDQSVSKQGRTLRDVLRSRP